MPFTSMEAEGGYGGSAADADADVADYEAFTDGLPFRIRFDCSGGRGKFAQASTELRRGDELLEEAPLICWPRPCMLSGIRDPESCAPRGNMEAGATASEPSAQSTPCSIEANGVAKEVTFCEACLRELPDLTCVKASCDTHHFCSERCASHPAFAVLTMQRLQSLRRIQAYAGAAARDAVITLEAVARAAAHVLGGALKNLQASLPDAKTSMENASLDPALDADELSAALDACLAEAFRPFERFASTPVSVSVELEGFPADPTEAADDECQRVADWTSVIRESLGDGLRRACEESVGDIPEAAEAVAAALEEAVLSPTFLRDLLRAMALNVKELTLGLHRWPAAGIYIMLACFNHSCEPSVHVSSQSDASIILVAARRIGPHEELTVNYTSPWDRPLKDRQAQLKSRWLLKCQCSRCVAELTLSQGESHPSTGSTSNASIVSVQLTPDYVCSKCYATSVNALLREGVVVLPGIFSVSDVECCHGRARSRFETLDARLRELAAGWKRCGLFGVPGGHQFLEIVERDGSRFDFQVWRHGQSIGPGDPTADALRSDPLFAWADPTAPVGRGEPALRREGGGCVLGPLLDAMLGESRSAKLLFAGIVMARSVPHNPAEVAALSDHQHQEWHRDGALLFNGALGAPLPPHCLQVFVPLQDLHEKNGPTEFRLGSHRRPDDDTTGSTAAVHAPCGSAYIFDYRIYHRGLANFSGRDRYVAYFVFSRSWFMDVKNYATTRTMASVSAGLQAAS